MNLNLDGKIALVTGSSKGIGEGIARGLAREGVVVIIHGRDKAKAEEVANEICLEGGRSHVVTGDLTCEDDVQCLVEKAQAFVRPIDILVNNAGGSGEQEDWATTQSRTWIDGYERNVIAAVRVTSRVLPAMRVARWGRVINISSLAAMMPPAARPDYGAAKAAMLAMTASLAKDVAADGITANTVSPGTIHSTSLEMAFRKVAVQKGIAQDAPWPEVEQGVLSQFADVPVRRVGTLEEVADAVAFLASPRAAYITGSNLRLDGGLWPGL
ncbi:NAD(P)-dependent dehydrogenase (short-subunit alcohol dehydrogenase family) [Agrobacterium sp. RC10-4-1]|uniref:SDR family NAD(P)-dependent oxidoreductase n=1 Tax=Agrobacterium sp. RC10-4-1 TaxID=2587039 RepID=UPI0015FC9CB7|nr:SDR family NAD(P)-dependent oxidoreductase [Agrobacterium sp. RC10-4-1]MBA8801348.1 NAD(P)-dependent dehydrogenase (short-subunit alcohol dehydrogenase family) [Agrobacterium sp. RC10-4-1]